jgi:hypothetical protein
VNNSLTNSILLQKKPLEELPRIHFISQSLSVVERQSQTPKRSVGKLASSRFYARRYDGSWTLNPFISNHNFVSNSVELKVYADLPYFREQTAIALE